MDLFMHSLRRYSVELNEKGIRIRFIGDRDAFSDDLRDQIAATELLTAGNDLMTLNIAANYGGQWDILNAVKTILGKLQRNEISSEQIDTTLFESALSLSNTPDPDLFIRTGGEQRISNFLLWQIAYAELYFTDILWPDFSEVEMQKALDVYSQRQRRYGKTGDQVGI
jgi:undecaprenyl diphosphate synthase